MSNLFFDAGRIIEIAEESQGNDIYMTLKLVLLTSEVNLNKIQYSEDFINEIAENKEKYISIPLVAEMNKLEDGKYDNLTHKQNKKTGQFGTQMIGSFVDFETNQNGDVLELIGTARIPKRFAKTCEAIQELYDEGNLKFSYEIAVGEYKVQSGTKYVDKSENNFLIAMCVVSTPAVPKATALMLVAALESDFNIENEGDIMTRNKEITCEEFFANTKVHYENAELDLNQIQRKIYLSLRSLLGDDWYNYDIKDMYSDYVIISNYYDGDYYKVEYSISNDEVVLSEKVKVTKTYLTKEDNEMTLAEIQAKLEIAEAKIKELEATVTDKDNIIAEKDGVIAEKETVIAEKDGKVTELSEQVNKLSESVVLKDNEIAELKPAKEELDKINLEKAEAEKVEKKSALKDKYSKLLAESIMSLPEIAEAIEKLDETVLQAKVVEAALEKADNTKQEPTTQTASRILDNIEVHGSDVVSKYITVHK